MHVLDFYQKLLHKIEPSEIGPSFVITHRLTLDDGPGACMAVSDKQDGGIKVVMTL